MLRRICSGVVCAVGTAVTLACGVPPAGPSDLLGLTPGEYYLVVTGRNCEVATDDSVSIVQVGTAIHLQQDGAEWVGRSAGPATLTLRLRDTGRHRDGLPIVEGTVTGSAAHEAPRAVPLHRDTTMTVTASISAIVDQAAVVGAITGAIRFTTSSGVAVSCADGELSAG